MFSWAKGHYQHNGIQTRSFDKPLGQDFLDAVHAFHQTGRFSLPTLPVRLLSATLRQVRYYSEALSFFLRLSRWLLSKVHGIS